jgi:translation initiation factor IF-3
MGFVESQAKQDGRNMIMVLAPHRSAKTAAATRKGEGDAPEASLVSDETVAQN